MKAWTDRLVDMIFRGVVGLVIIYILERICFYTEFLVFAGVNIWTFLLTAFLGVPGFLLIFIISIIHFY